MDLNSLLSLASIKHTVESSPEFFFTVFAGFGFIYHWHVKHKKGEIKESLIEYWIKIEHLAHSENTAGWFTAAVMTTSGFDLLQGMTAASVAMSGFVTGYALDSRFNRGTHQGVAPATNEENKP